MELTTYSNAGAFLQQTQTALEQDEVANNLMLGIAMRLWHSPDTYKSTPYLATVRDHAGLVAAALMTPPHPLTLYAHRQTLGDACELIAGDLLANGWPVRAVSGRAPLAGEFAAVWSRLTGADYKINVHMRIYVLHTVTPAPPVAGRFRVATEADLGIVAQWSRAFIMEALPADDPNSADDMAQRRVREGDIYLWEDGGHAVSMAAKSRPMNNGITVNLVYTPPEQRGRGYATACVATLSQRLLDEGWKFCVLFTDLSNPTSNSIYQKIGYRPVCDFDEYGFALSRH
ncbi:MAG: GNAT family N-acetyltransferase [Chloroflexi bacterium]|nr:GNAT family N-acetyltransferase [Chloroflexota bacterium]